MKYPSLQDSQTVSIEDGEVELRLEMRKVRTVDKVATWSGSVCLIAELTVGTLFFILFIFIF